RLTSQYWPLMPLSTSMRRHGAITLAPKKLILTRRASEGSASEPSLARRVSMCKDAKLSCRGNMIVSRTESTERDQLVAGRHTAQLPGASLRRTLLAETSRDGREPRVAAAGR